MRPMMPVIVHVSALTECFEFIMIPLLNETAFDSAHGGDSPIVGGHCQCSWGRLQFQDCGEHARSHHDQLYYVHREHSDPKAKRWEPLARQ